MAVESRLEQQAGMQDGTRRSQTEIVANSVVFLGSPSSQIGGAGGYEFRGVAIRLRLIWLRP